jgi:FkbM family methyltransferase
VASYQATSNPEPLMTRRLLRNGAWLSAPMRVIDGGARYGAEKYWGVYGSQLELYAFEPDEEECQRTMAAVRNGPGDIHFTCSPLAIGRESGKATLNLARYPDSSSLLPTNDALVRRFAMSEYLEQVGTTTVETTDIESFMREHVMNYVDFMKLDVEGAELDVLRGAGERLRGALLGLDVEVWFQEDHVGRPLFDEVDGYLRDLGFALFDLRQLSRWRRKTLAGPSYTTWIGSGQLMYGNALYFRDVPALLASGAAPPPKVAFLKLASLAELFCYHDFAIEVLDSGRQSGLLEPTETAVLIADLSRQAPATRGGWRAVVRRAARSSIPPRLRRRLMRILEGLLTE